MIVSLLLTPGIGRDGKQSGRRKNTPNQFLYIRKTGNSLSVGMDMIEIRKLFKNPDYYLDMISMSLEALNQKYMDASKVENIIFYRAHHVTRTIETAFLQKKLPYAIYSGTQFYDRAEVKDALSYLRMIAYQDDLSFLRICNRPKRNLGKKRTAFLQEYATQNQRSLYQTLLENLEDPTFKGTQAQTFTSLVQVFSMGYAQRPISEVLSAVLD